MRRSSSAYGLLLLLLLSAPVLRSQDTLLVNEEQFIRQVLRFHPKLAQSEMKVEEAAAKVQASRAAFDPVWASEWASKTFEDKPYYDYQESYFSWQAPPGITFKAGGNRSRGDFINPELNTPADGLFFAEIAIPLGDGLFRTPEQTKLQQARINEDKSWFQLELVSRNLAYKSAEVFWNWVAGRRELALREEISELASIRLRQTVLRYEQGAATGMDTLEAYTQYLTRESDRLAAAQNVEAWYRAAGSMLWEPGLFNRFRENRLAVDTTWYTPDLFRSLSGRNGNLNPLLSLLSLNRRSAQLDYALAREQLKPDLNFKARALSGQQNLGLTSISGNSAVFGFSAYIPLLSRKERANIRIADLRIRQLETEINDAERQLMQQYEQFVNQRILLAEQLQQIEDNVINAQRLLELENRRLSLGVSTLFLVNARESKYISEQLKLISVKQKLRLLDWKLNLLVYSPEELLD